VRVLIFHGYLLRGTGSNIYSTSLCRALARLGHEVHLLCQERHAEELDLPGAVHIHNPDIGEILPVYVADRYEGFTALPFPELDDAQLDHYLEANVSAVREVAERARPDVALANHLVMGPVVLARGLQGKVPYAVKIHGSALEYTVRPHRQRFLPYALEGLRAASGVLVGSRHTAESLWEVTALSDLPARTRLGPPGVDVHTFRPRGAEQAVAGLHRLAERVAGGEAAAWGGSADAAEALAALDPRSDRIVGYVGKLIVSKGVDLLLAAWPLVVARVPQARLAVVGFGTYREALERFVALLRDENLDGLRDLARSGRELEGGPPGELRFLAAFLDGLRGERRREYLEAAPDAAARVHFTGRLEHDDLPDFLPACAAQAMPSTFPESFGMVAVEAAACGVLPLSAGHSGMAEVTATLEPALEEDLRPLLSFRVGEGAVEEIASKLVRWLTMDVAERARATAALAEVARRRYGWESVAEGVIAAAQGRLGELPEPGAPDTPSGAPSG
jgi:glycosyltransferase involved in cell wall biosynthesis